MKNTSSERAFYSEIIAFLNMCFFVVQAVFIWLVIGAIIRRKYRRCIERNEIFYLDDEFGN